ncbi:MAG: BTAD domain-containing putative transcriptional regulator, partial [Gemmatimonadota bacterium]
MIELRTLGAVDVTEPSDDADPAAVRSRPKALALLVYLALASRDGPVRRDVLLGLLWPELSQERARRALSQTLYTLRSALGADLFDGSGHEDLRVRPEALDCDACAFLDALDDDRGGDALALYAGDFLKGFHPAGCPEFDRWADERRSEFRRSAVRTALGLAREAAKAGEAMEVARSVRWALSHAPHDEGVLREGLGLLDRVGNPAAALDAYEAFAGRLREELELEPSAETERLVAEIRGQAKGGAPIPSLGEDSLPIPTAAPSDAVTPTPAASPAEPGTAPAGAGRGSGPFRWMVAAAVVPVVAALALWQPWAAGKAPADPISEKAPLAEIDESRPRIAVLPLESLSASEEDAYLAAGLHEELLRRLSLVRSLSVISRTSVLRYADTDMGAREIAADLGVRYVMEGTVQRDGERVRVHVQLIDAPADRHVWAERFDRTLDDLFALQSEIAESTARELEAVITPEERTRIEARPTEDPIAYDLYLRAAGLGVSVKEEYDAGIALLRRATRRDPGFALAHASLAWRYWAGAIEHRYPPLDSSLTRSELALRLDPALPLGHAVRGWLLGTQNRYGEARVSLQRAVALNPSEGLAWAGMAAIEWWSGNPVEGAIAGRRGVQVDPLSPQASNHMAISL